MIISLIQFPSGTTTNSTPTSTRPSRSCRWKVRGLTTFQCHAKPDLSGRTDAVVKDVGTKKRAADASRVARLACR